LSDLRAPFTYPGGKSRVVEICWRAFGPDVPAYVELCAGSAAMLLGRPGGAGKYETINDASGYVANVWRALKRYPDEAARHADNPPCELDMRARASMLREWGPAIVAQLGKDPEWCDPKAAGWWIWCQSLALGIDWMRPGKAVACKGSRKGILGLEQPDPRVTFARLSQRLRRVLIACGDWSALVTPSALGFNTTGTTPVAIFADPPYPDEDIDYGAEPDVARKVAAWCANNGDDPRLRIVLCGHVGDYDLPGWTTLNWGASRGWGRTKRGDNECLWFSPHCLPLEQQRGLFDEVAHA
jgi:hypothetical protein